MKTSGEYVNETLERFNERRWLRDLSLPVCAPVGTRNFTAELTSEQGSFR